MTKKRFTLLYGTSKVNFSAIAPAICEYTDNYVLVITSSENFSGYENIIFKGNPELNYKICTASSEKSLDEFLKKMETKNVRVGIITDSHTIYPEILRKNGNFMFSACRNGILRQIPNICCNINTYTMLFLFDNDETLVEEINKRVSNNEIQAFKCVVHSVCSNMELDSFNKSIILDAGMANYLYFPPNASIVNMHIASLDPELKLDFVRHKMNLILGVGKSYRC